MNKWQSYILSLAVLKTCCYPLLHFSCINNHKTVGFGLLDFLSSQKLFWTEITCSRWDHSWTLSSNNWTKSQWIRSFVLITRMWHLNGLVNWNNPKKLKKLGYKVFLLCDSKGIAYNLDIYMWMLTYLCFGKYLFQCS